MSFSSKSIAIGLSALALLLAPIVSAAPSEADKERAKALYIEGMDLRQEGKKSEALTKFQEAYKLLPTPITGLAVGRAYEEAGKLVEARDVYDNVGELPAKATESKDAKVARTQAVKLRAEVDARIPRIRVELVGISPGTKTVVQLDGEEVPRAALSSERGMNPGAHTVTVDAGGIVKKSSFQLIPGEPIKTLTIDFSSDATRPVATRSPLARTETRTNPAVYWGLGIGAAGVGLGFLAFVRYTTLKSCIDGGCNNSTAHGEKNDWAFAFDFVALPLILVGTGTTAYGLTSPSRVDTKSARSGTAWIGITSNGVRFAGTF